MPARREGDGPLAVGARAIVTRQAGRRERARTEEITELNPPRTWAVHGGGGPLIAIAKVTIGPLDAGQRSRVTTAPDFKAHVDVEQPEGDQPVTFRCEYVGA